MSRIPFAIDPQPDETTCGPTCLHSLYRFYDSASDLTKTIDEVHALDAGGTLGAFLASHALRHGYKATIYSYNVELFDPTWHDLSKHALAKKLVAQASVKRSKKMKTATRAYLEFLELGGELRFDTLSAELLARYLDAQTPLLVGLSATYLYACARELDDREDDVAGGASGHFVVLLGLDQKRGVAHIADPFEPNPYSPELYYDIEIARLIGAIYLGVLTFDANLLVIEPATS